MSQRSRIEECLKSRFPENLVDGLIEALHAMQTEYLQRRFRPTELEAGHFAEWAFRICEDEVLGSSTPVGRSLTALDRLAQKLASSAAGHDSFRLHIPRVLLGIAEVRNRRGVGHPSGDVDPNAADALLVTTGASWVAAEMFRHAASSGIADAQALLDGLVERRVPLIEDFSSGAQLITPGFSARAQCLLLLLHSNSGVDRGTLRSGLLGVGDSAFRGALSKMRAQGETHEDSGMIRLTRTGIAAGESILVASL